MDGMERQECKEQRLQIIRKNKIIFYRK